MDSVIHVEFFGVARHRAGTPSARISTDDVMTLQSVWQALINRYPQLPVPGPPALERASIYRFNVDGNQFVTDPLTPIRPGQCILVMSADAGG